MVFVNEPSVHLLLVTLLAVAGHCEGQASNRSREGLNNGFREGLNNRFREGLNNRFREGLNQFISTGLNVLRPLLKQTVDFSDIAPGLDIRLGNLKVNGVNRFTRNHLIILEAMLQGVSLKEKMRIWGLTAQYLHLFQPSVTRFQMKDLSLFENDVVLTDRSIRTLLAEAQDQLNRTDGTPRRVSPTVTPQQPVSPTGIPQRRKRKITVNVAEKWDSAVIPWHMEKKLFAPREKALIRKSLNQWEKETCLSFVEKKKRPAGDYINFTKKLGCSSYIGKQGGPQDISLNGDICFTLGTAMHEIGHALGMWHEQSRPDRDLYVTVVEPNVEFGLLGQFQKRTWDTVDSIAVPYDYGSVMHYGRKDFSWNSQDTLKTKWDGYEQTLGQVLSASFYDVKIVNYWYCSDKCASADLDWHRCENDGYRDPRNCKQCKCPDGFKPPYCKEIQTHTIAKCGNNELRAMARWSTLESPGYPNMKAGPGACTWRITAPAGSRVELEFVDDFLLARPVADSCVDYIEVRYRDLALTGPRFCGFNKPHKSFVSEEQSMLLLLRRVVKNGNYKGFKLRYRAAGCGGCSANSPGSQPACVETYRYTCGGRFTCNWLGRKYCHRANTCLRTVYSCCSGYTRNGQTCTKV